ncbi:VanZ family protein [Bacillus sp. 1P06AnD]|uniref:VanZ family protein n=1 Tax=Bacillus sp. 1P06AnD TaxID=3132208 RepID=UPI0039A2133B
MDNWGSVSLLNLTANTLLFFPFGFFLPLIWDTCNSFKRMLFIVLIVTISVEILQFFIGRSTDIDDVILNTFGAIMGYGIYSLLKWFIAKTSFNRNPVKDF